MFILLRASHPRSAGSFNAGAVPRKNYLARLRSDAHKFQAAGIIEQVMLSFSTDVYNPIDTSLTRLAIEILVEHSLAFCVLTKGGTRALVDIDL
jgi:DNA repair photolyase